MRLGEFEIALIVRGHRHDGARAIGDHDVIRDPNGYGFIIDRVDGIGAGEDAGSFPMFQHAFDFGLQRGLAHIFVDGCALLRCGDDVDQIVLGRQHHEGGAPERVGTGGVDLDGMIADGGSESGARPFTAADPVRLHDLDRFRPVQSFEIQQFVGVFGDG